MFLKRGWPGVVDYIVVLVLIELRKYVDTWPITGIAFQSLLISYKVTTFNIIWKIKCTRIYFFYLLDQWFWTFQIWFNCSELGSPSPSSCINKRLLCKEGCDNYNWSWTLGWNLNWIQEKWWKIVQPSLPELPLLHSAEGCGDRIFWNDFE